MTCCFRHVKRAFGGVGIEVTPDSKKEINRIISSLVNVDNKNCLKVWSEIKRRPAKEKDRSASDLTRALAPLTHMENPSTIDYVQWQTAILRY